MLWFTACPSLRVGRRPGRRFPSPGGHHRLVVVADRVLVDPEVVAAGGPVELEVLAGRVRRPEPDDVRLATKALAALRPLHDRVVGVDLRGADDVSGSAAGGADVRGLEKRRIMARALASVIQEALCLRAMATSRTRAGDSVTQFRCVAPLRSAGRLTARRGSGRSCARRAPVSSARPGGPRGSGP